jgi:hypothetical protein
LFLCSFKKTESKTSVYIRQTHTCPHTIYIHTLNVPQRPTSSSYFS